MALWELQWASTGSVLASIMFLGALLHQYFPFNLERFVTKHAHRLLGRVYPYLQLSIAETSGERMKRSEAYAATCSQRASRLRVEFAKDSSNPSFSMDDAQDVVDEFQDARFWWSHRAKPRTSQSFSFYPTDDLKRSYVLTFHRRDRDRDLVMTSYLPHVMRQGREVQISNRQRKLYTNNPSKDWHGYKISVWSHVVFEHPSTFNTVAMDPLKKEELISDLDSFRRRKSYYAQIGKAWKRGYLLYGPPGTGKSTMIAAIANYMDYDIYDLELTSVKDNTELRKLFIETTSKSIIVIEDIDCSLDLTGKRKPKEKKKDESAEDKTNPMRPLSEEGKEDNKVTLSGLLNFIDGLWSACGGERLIIFTTNYLDKLDPALIRRGRMDKHIEMSYCGFEAFKVLAANYLGVHDHPLYDGVSALLGEVDITPAEVAENLMPKFVDDDAETSLHRLIDGLKKAKEEAANKVTDDDKDAIEMSTAAAVEETEQKGHACQTDPKKNEDGGKVADDYNSSPVF